MNGWKRSHLNTGPGLTLQVYFNVILINICANFWLNLTSNFIKLAGRAHCDVLLNNICEVFNRQLVDGRDKPIITCLEYIRVYLMKRIVNVQKVISKSDGILTPNANKIFQAIVKDASQIKVHSSFVLTLQFTCFKSLTRNCMIYRLNGMVLIYIKPMTAMGFSV